MRRNSTYIFSMLLEIQIKYPGTKRFEVKSNQHAANHVTPHSLHHTFTVSSCFSSIFDTFEIELN